MFRGYWYTVSDCHLQIIDFEAIPRQSASISCPIGRNSNGRSSKTHRARCRCDVIELFVPKPHMTESVIFRDRMQLNESCGRHQKLGRNFCRSARSPRAHTTRTRKTTRSTCLRIASDYCVSCLDMSHWIDNQPIKNAILTKK